MKKTHIIVAIDGYSSCGKSTVARALAQKLGFIYIDSGAMYRVVTLYFLRQGILADQTDRIAQALQDIHMDIQPDGQQFKIYLNGEDVTRRIRDMDISEQVSEISSIRAVRQALVKQQQKMAERQNIVMDGRDIGTTVFPHAQVKIFMTADPKVRADRRYKEIHAQDPSITLEQVFENIAHRDYQDTTRRESPLVHAPDAITLDNTLLSEEEQLDFVLQEVKKHLE